MDFWILLFERLQSWPISDHDFGAWKIKLNKGLNILLDSYTADIQENRTGQVGERIIASAGFNPAVWAELLCIYAASPSDQVDEPFGLQLFHHAGGRHHDFAGVFMKPTDETITCAGRDWQARGDVFRKSRVICR